MDPDNFIKALSRPLDPNNPWGLDGWLDGWLFEQKLHGGFVSKMVGFPNNHGFSY